MKRSFQAPSAVLMVRPTAFSPNPETAYDNLFQSAGGYRDSAIADRACAETEQTARLLEEAGVRVHLLKEREEDSTPDCVFPNNWISTHASGEIVVYPMCAANRRRERRPDAVSMLTELYHVSAVHDYSTYESQGLYLEGTGAMIIDHDDAKVYVARSARASEVVLERFCTDFDYQPIVFDARFRGAAVYHTNVMMSIGLEFALVGLELVSDPEQRHALRSELEENGRRVIELTTAQVENFAANCLALASSRGPVLAISARGIRSLEPSQLRLIEQHTDILSVPIPTIELAGGSVRCMLAGIHLEPR